MNFMPNMKRMLGLLLVMGMVGGDTNWLIGHSAVDTSEKELEAVKALLLVHNPGQISYISFPMSEPLTAK